MTIGRIPSVEGGIQPTIFDAKADLLTATANDTPARLAVGSNDQVLVADSAASTGLAWKSYGAQFVAGKNKIINGDFGIWQRGTSFTTSGNYTADRWAWDWAGTGTTTVTQQTFTPGTAPVSGYEGQYYWQIALGTGATYTSIYQRIEDVRTLAGQTVTVSFWAKATSSVTFLPYFRQSFGSGGSSDVDTIGSSVTFTNTWTRYTRTVTLPSIAGKTIGTGNYLSLIIVGNSGTFASNTIQYWGFQLEAGSVATPFTTATGTIQGELAACQRYYYRVVAGSGAYNRFGVAQCYSTTKATVYVQFPVSMRIIPTAVEQSGTAADYALLNATSTVTACSAVPTYDGATVAGATTDFTVASGLVAGNASQGLDNNVATAYLGWSAEL